MSTAIVSQPVRRAAPVETWPLRLVTGWHLLSLDAPSVAVVWLLLLNRSSPLRDRGIEAAALAIAVWIIYVLDRLLDAKRQAGVLQQRHRFHRNHGRSFLRVLLLLLPLLTALVFALPAHVRFAWSVMGLPLLAYAAWVHLVRSRIPKELVVAVFFAVVTAVPSWAGGLSLSGLVPAIAFCALCWWNCLFIRAWEERTGPRRDGTASHLRFIALLAVGAAVVCLMYSGARPAGLAAMLSAALLLLLHRNRGKLDAVLLRSLADAALLTPLLLLPVLHWL